MSVTLANRLYVLRVVTFDDFLSDFKSDETLAVLGEALAITVSLVLVIVIVTLTFVWMRFVDQQRRQAVAVLAVTRKTHNVVVGYVCHELRNPYVLSTVCEKK